METWQKLYAGDGAFQTILAVAIDQISDVIVHPVPMDHFCLLLRCLQPIF